MSALLGPGCGRRSLRVVPFLPLNPLEAKDMGTQLAGVVPTPPKYCNRKETLKGTSMGPEVYSKIAPCLILPQRQAVGEGGGLGSSKEGKSSGETAGQWGQRKNPRWGGPLTDCCVASSSSLPVSGPQPLAQFNKGG